MSCVGLYPDIAAATLDAACIATARHHLKGPAAVLQLRAHGRVVRPYIGIKMLQLNAGKAAALARSDPRFPRVQSGILVPQVRPAAACTGREHMQSALLLVRWCKQLASYSAHHSTAVADPCLQQAPSGSSHVLRRSAQPVPHPVHRWCLW